jgi:hypothetical protein
MDKFHMHTHDELTVSRWSTETRLGPFLSQFLTEPQGIGGLIPRGDTNKNKVLHTARYALQSLRLNRRIQTSKTAFAWNETEFNGSGYFPRHLC